MLWTPLMVLNLEDTGFDVDVENYSPSLLSNEHFNPMPCCFPRLRVQRRKQESRFQFELTERKKRHSALNNNNKKISTPVIQLNCPWFGNCTCWEATLDPEYPVSMWPFSVSEVLLIEGLEVRKQTASIQSTTQAKPRALEMGFVGLTTDRWPPLKSVPDSTLQVSWGANTTSYPKDLKDCERHRLSVCQTGSLGWRHTHRLCDQSPPKRKQWDPLKYDRLNLHHLLLL